MRLGLHPLRSAPLRIRLVAGFAAAMIVVLSGAGAFVFWRARVALDNTLRDQQLAQTAGLHQALVRYAPVPALASLPSGPVIDQVLDPSGRVLAATPDAGEVALVPARRLPSARTGRITFDTGHLLYGDQRRLRVVAFALTAVDGRDVIAVAAVRLDARDDNLRELLALLSIANLAALVIASLVGYRLARAALAPVERYRSRAEEIASGATGVRLDVAPDIDDEVSRLGHTLNRMLSAQERAASAQRQFLADASHELRTPLTVLTSEVELALRRPRTRAELEATLRNVAEDTARLVRLADQLLDLERAQEAVVVPVGAGVPASGAVERAALRARVRLADTDRQVATSVEGTLRLAATESQLDQLLGNLVDNAITHGRGAVAVSAATVTAGVQLLGRLQVSDEGDGMPPEFVPHAVERFRRAEASRTSPGSGLGLALVQAIAAGLGGELRVCTRGSHHTYPPQRFDGLACAHPETGTTITVLLPALPS